jgi:hypothetical protein
MTWRDLQAPDLEYSLRCIALDTRTWMRSVQYQCEELVTYSHYPLVPNLSASG